MNRLFHPHKLRRDRTGKTDLTTQERSSGVVAATHLPVLDGLRGVAILLVLASHCGSGLFGALSLYSDTNGVPHSFGIPAWADLILGFGYQGVTLFFVVSAFTLMRQAMRGGLSPVWDYALRRVMRIGPGFWVAAIVYAALLGLGPGQSAPAGFDAADIAAGVTFTGWLVGHSATNIVPGGWSVQVEAVFYTALPLLAWLIRGRLWRAILLTLTAGLVAQVLARHAMVQGLWTYDSYNAPLFQLPVFLLGMSAALLLPFGAPYRRVAGPLALCCFGAAILVVPYMRVFAWSLLPHLQFAGLAAAGTLLATWSPPRLLASAALVRIGTLSYSMYLFHFLLLWPMYMVASHLIPGNGLATLGVYFALVLAGSAGISTLTYRWIEQPPRRWIASRLRARQHTCQNAVMPNVAMHESGTGVQPG